MRIVVDNPGAWFLHCHLEWHLAAGLAVQIIAAPIQAQERARAAAPLQGRAPAQIPMLAGGMVPGDMERHCHTLGMQHEGNAAGRMSRTDLSGWKLGPDVVKEEDTDRSRNRANI